MSEEVPAPLSDQIKVLLLGEDPAKAVDLITDETHLEELEESSWNIVETVSSHLTIENAKGNASLFKICETILYIIAEKCKPSEIVLEFLEQMENSDNDVKFCAILKPLSLSFKKLEDKSKAFDWCVNTMKSYVETLPLPDDEISPEGIDSKSRIFDVYRAIISFLKTLVEEASLGNENTSNIRNHLLSLLLSLLGKPFCYVSSNSQASKAISESIINSICELTGDCFRFLTIVVERDKPSRKLKDEASKSAAGLFESARQVSDLAYANFYYLLLTKENLQEKFPQIYDPEYILHNCFYLACIFLQNQEIVLISKGLSLIESVMTRVEKFSLGQQALELSVHSKLFPCLIQVMVYCESDEQRKKAVDIFRNYVDLFTLQARYLVVLQLYKITNHSGLLSLIHLIVKDSVIKCLDHNPPCPHFLGPKLQNLLSLICKLSHGSATDLIEITKEIIGALNLLLFLAIRDKENKTGFWDYTKELEKSYLKDLRSGIDLSRAHWKLKLKDLEVEKNSPRTNPTEMGNQENDDVTITVGGEDLSMMSVSEKMEFSHLALTSLDMIENVLTRVNERLEDHRLKLCSEN